MRRPRSKRAPRGPRAKLYECKCKSCACEFSYVSEKEPRYCISCKSDHLEVKAYAPKTGDAPFQPGFFSFKFETRSTGSADPLADLFGQIFSALLGGRFHSEMPPPPSRPRLTMSREEAALFIAGFSETPKDYILDSPQARESAYKRAAKACHPDTGGSHDLFVKLQQAKEALDL